MLREIVLGAKVNSPTLKRQVNLTVAHPIDKNDTDFGASDILLAKDVAVIASSGDTEKEIEEIKTDVNSVKSEIEKLKGDDYVEFYAISTVTIRINGQEITIQGGETYRQNGPFTQISRVGDGISYCNLENLDSSNLNSLYNVFNSKDLTQELQLNNWKVPKSTSMTFAFAGLTNVPAIYIANLDTSNVTSLQYAFKDDTSLEILEIGNWNTEKVDSFKHAFYNCSSLKTLNLSSFSTKGISSSQGFGNMFGGCSNLTTLVFGPKWGIQKAVNTLDLSTIGSSNNYELNDLTYSSMLTMYDRKTAGYSNMTIKLSKNHNIPDGWTDSMNNRGYTITLV